MFSWKGKKLLVLGATRFIAEIVKNAQKYGAYVVVADYNESAPAKKIADEALLIDVMDINKIIEYIRNNNIDGIITGFTDALLSPYYMICKKTGLPCYINEEQILFTTDKILFKQKCKEFDIPIINEYVRSDNVCFPVIVKPVDNSGSRGISVCYTKEDFDKGIQNALDFSKSKKILIEDYLNLPEATVFYMFLNGVPYLIAMADRHVKILEHGVLQLPTGYTFPSKGLDTFLEKSHHKFCDMFKSLRMKNGILFIQGFLGYENNEFIPYECGYRLTGSLEYKLIESMCGYNPLDMLINFALTGKMVLDWEQTKVNPFFLTKAYNISCLINTGKVCKIQGIENIMELPDVIDCFLSYDIGDTISDNIRGKLAQIFLRILFTTKYQNYEEIISCIKSNLKVLDEFGNEMLINKEILY